MTVAELKIAKTKKGLTWSCTNCSDLGNDIDELKAIIVKLTKEVNELKSQKFMNLDNLTFENVLHELEDRQNRKKNIIIFNVEERKSDNKTERINKDKEVVTQILQALPGNVSDINLAPVRLGKYDENNSKVRPIKITLNDSNMVHDIIHKTKNLMDAPNLKHIRISLDRTKRQVEFYKSVKAELEARVAAGESNLKIKHINGVPQIKSDLN